MGMELVERELLQPDVQKPYLAWPLVFSLMLEESLEKLGVALLLLAQLRQLALSPQPVLAFSITQVAPVVPPAASPASTGQAPGA
jgi:hypothetical protein